MYTGRGLPYIRQTPSIRRTGEYASGFIEEAEHELVGGVERGVQRAVRAVRLACLIAADAEQLAVVDAVGERVRGRVPLDHHTNAAQARKLDHSPHVRLRVDLRRPARDTDTNVQYY